MSLSSSVQHLGSGVGAFVAGLVIGRSPTGELTDFGLVGLAAGCTALASIGLAAGLRPAAAGAEAEALAEPPEVGLALCPEVAPACVGGQEAA